MDWLGQLIQLTIAIARLLQRSLLADDNTFVVLGITYFYYTLTFFPIRRAASPVLSGGQARGLGHNHIRTSTDNPCQSLTLFRASDSEYMKEPSIPKLD